MPCRQPSSAVRVVEAVSDCGGSQVQVELDLGDDTQAGRLYRPMVVPGQFVTTLRFTYADSITRPGRAAGRARGGVGKRATRAIIYACKFATSRSSVHFSVAIATGRGSGSGARCWLAAPAG